MLGGNTYLVSTDVVNESPPVVAMAIDSQLDCAVGAVPLTSAATPPPGETIVERLWFVNGNPIAGLREVYDSWEEDGARLAMTRALTGC